MRVLLILISCALAACSAGNLSINGAPPVRVSECSMSPTAVITYTLRGKQRTETVRHAYFENTIISTPGSDMCQEFGWFCGGEK